MKSFPHKPSITWNKSQKQWALIKYVKITLKLVCHRDRKKEEKMVMSNSRQEGREGARKGITFGRRGIWRD